VKRSGRVIDAHFGHPQALKQLGFRTYAEALSAGLIRVGYTGSKFWASNIGVQVFELNAQTINRIEGILWRLVVHPCSALSIDWAVVETRQPYGHLNFQNIDEAREQFKGRALRILAKGGN
jgi:hypothetical protein